MLPLMNRFLFTVALVALLQPGGAAAQRSDAGDWPAYGGQKSGSRFSELTQINRENIANLAPAWQFEMPEPGESQTQAIVIDGVVYGFSPSLDVIALDGASGELLWRFSAPGKNAGFTGPSRGLAMWQGPDSNILFAGIMNRLFALDPETGRPVPGFGDNGFLDLRKDLPGDYRRYYVSMTAPGIIYKDLIIVGFRTGENPPAAPGDIRAYDVSTGALRWSFHTIPGSMERGGETWPENARQNQGGANSWPGFALDEERGIVYIPTGSAVPDFYGANRPGDNLYANSLLALNAQTGERIWHFQTVHHDIWDRDLPSSPTLVRVSRNGELVDAVVQTSKQGYVFLFDRTTGEPLFSIEEKPFPASAIPGEVTSSTQPVPALPEPFARQRLTEDMLTQRTPAMNAWAREQFARLNSQGQFVPFNTQQPTVVFPGFDGGAEWGGSAVDPTRGILYVNSNDVAWTGSLVESPKGVSMAEAVYQANCAVCHGIDREGSPPEFPGLLDVGNTLEAEEIIELVRNGKGRMQGFSALPAMAVSLLAGWLRNGETSFAPADEDREAMASLFTQGDPVDYRFTGYQKFLDPKGYPAVAPPWGTLNAIDLNSGETLWQVPLGQYPELVAQGMADTGSENYGGPVVTASGLLFIGATIYDRKLRAFDAGTGELLWEYEMPYAGTATPAMYMIDGKQTLVILGSNARNGQAPMGSAYMAFRLPD